MKEQVSVDEEPTAIILGYDVTSPDGDKSVVIIDYEEYERLKTVEEENTRLKDEINMLIESNFNAHAKIENLKRLDENVKKKINELTIKLDKIPVKNYEPSREWIEVSDQIVLLKNLLLESLSK